MNSKITQNSKTFPTAANTTRELYSRILGMIVDKEILPGSKINQIKLAERLQASRTPIVKALHKLESQGLVDNIPDSGFVVHELSMLELLELWELREALDSIVIIELVDTITQAQTEQLERLVEKFERTAEQVDEEQYRKTDREFHSLLLEFSRNTMVKRINQYFQIHNRCYTVGLLRKPQETLPEHRRVVEALRNRDREEAREAMVAHISKTKVFLQELVQRLRQVGIDPSTIPFKEAEK
jgi:DNA-binding GntR family transcriptional regulator